ncbi:MAG: XRE family transcriptional regulator [Acetobacteraceae bacterium]|nr:XRE family transcriptional regulator [Acetobacteraceae bacterium]
MALPVSSANRAKPIVIPVRAKTERALAIDPGLMTDLMETYAEALERSRLIGRPVRFEVDVRPRGAPDIIPVDDRPSAAAGDDGLEAAFDAARTRGRVRVAEILGGDDMLSAEAFASLIGTSRMTVNVRRQNHRILGLEGAKRGYRFPNWQLGKDGKPFSALPALFERFDEDPWPVYFFLVRRHPELGGKTGRDALWLGWTAKVLEAADSVARGDFA